MKGARNVARRTRAQKFTISAAISTAVFALVAILLPSPAGATIFDRFSVEEADSFVFVPLSNICGFEVQLAFEVSGDVIIREGKGKFDSAFFAHEKISYTETYSANGKYFTISGNFVFQETKAVPLGGSLFEFSSIQAGQPYTVRDMDGNVLLRDRGVIASTIVFDTLGDNVPGGTFIEEIDFRVGGPHPGLDVNPTQACALLAPDPT